MWSLGTRGFEGVSGIRTSRVEVSGTTHRPQGRSFLGLPYRSLNNMKPKKELLWGLCVGLSGLLGLKKYRLQAVGCRI